MNRDELREFILDRLRMADEYIERRERWRGGPANSLRRIPARGLYAEFEAEYDRRVAELRAAGMTKKEAEQKARDGLPFVGCSSRQRWFPPDGYEAPAELRAEIDRLNEAAPWLNLTVGGPNPYATGDAAVGERYARVLEWHRDLLAAHGIHAPASVREIAREATDPNRRNRLSSNRYFFGKRKGRAE